MNCELCGKVEATVHITQVHGDDFAKIDLCQSCAEKGGVNDPTGRTFLTLMEEVKKRKSQRGE